MKTHQHLTILSLLFTFLTVITFTLLDYQAIYERGIEIDSIGHIIGFFILTWFLYSIVKGSLLYLSLSLILYAALTEIGQFYLGFRNGEWSDFFADLFGISLFLLIKWCIHIYRKWKKS